MMKKMILTVMADNSDPENISWENNFYHTQVISPYHI